MPPPTRWMDLTFQARGPAFQPRRLSLPWLDAFHAGEVATFGGSRGRPVAFGCAVYRVPDDPTAAATPGEFAAACEHLATLMPALRAAGATDFILHVHHPFVERCTLELTRREVQALAALDCHLFFVGQPVDGHGG